MQYFVALEDGKDLLWQGELLYESIKLLGLQDDFVVAICPGNGKIRKLHFPNVVYFDNIGRKMGFPRFNKCYGLGKAIEANKLRQPFVVLDADMFLLTSLPQIDAPLAAQCVKSLSWGKVRNDLDDESIGTKWVDIGNIFQFNNVPNKVFEDVIKHTYDLYLKLGNKSNVHNYGFIMGIMKNNIPVNKRDDFEMPLTYDGSKDVVWSSKVVHYREGFPPYFRKEKAFDNINFSFNNIPLPMKLILDSPSKKQPNVAIMQTLIRSWIDSNLFRLKDLI